MLKDISGVLRSKVLICAVLRGSTVMLPKGDFVLKSGDRIFVTAPAKALGSLLRDLGVVTHKVKRVILGGGGRISQYLAQMLEQGGIQTQIIDNNMKRCQELARQLPTVSVSYGDITVPSILEKEGLSTADAFVALTGLDELNIVMSLYALSQNVPIVITKQGHIDELQDIVSGLSLGSIISPKELCSDIVVRYVRSMRDNSGDTAITVQSVAGGRVEAAEFIIGASSQHQDTPLLNIKMKPGVLIAAVSHRGQTEIASGSSRFTLGDSVVVISSVENKIHRFNDIFT